MQVRKAISMDAADIYQISVEHSLSNSNSLSDYTNKGFLVSEFGISDYRQFIEAGHVHVLENNNGIVAFIIVINRTNSASEALVREVCKHTDDNFAIVKQVCVKRQFVGKGLGRLLYKSVLNECGCDIYAAVVMDDVLKNQRSAYFHVKMGFFPAFKYIPDNGMKRIVYRKAFDIPLL